MSCTQRKVFRCDVCRVDVGIVRENGDSGYISTTRGYLYCSEKCLKMYEPEHEFLKEVVNESL